MAYIFKNWYEIKAKFTLIIEKIIENVSKKVLKDLQKQILEDVYYFDYYPNRYYSEGMGRPTFQFLRAWEWGELLKIANGVIRTLSYNDGKVIPSGKWTHRSSVKGYGESNTYLHKILNEANKGDGYRTSTLMAGKTYFSKKRKPYWDNFMELMMNGKLKKYFDEEFAKAGLKITHG